MARTKPISFLIFGAAVIVAFLISFMYYGKLRSKAKVSTSAIIQDIQPVVVAAFDLAPGTALTKRMITILNIEPRKVIEKDMMKVVPFLKKSLPDGCFSDISVLEGRVLIFPVNANEPIFESRLAPITIQTGGIAAVISPKKRAMSVRVNKVTGMSGLIHPGNRVDVIVAVTKEEKGGSSVAKTVLENIPILATGAELMAGKDREKPTEVEVITLEVTPEEAEKIALASIQGTIHVALRNFTDSADVFTKGITVPALLSSYGGIRNMSGIEENKGGGAQIYTVTLIKGNAVTQSIFEGEDKMP